MSNYYLTESVDNEQSLEDGIEQVQINQAPATQSNTSITSDNISYFDPPLEHY